MRTKAEVLEARKGLVGCCDRFADNMPCDCLEGAAEGPIGSNSRQVGGNHYAKHGNLQHWDVVAKFNLDYFQGQITKYVMRWKDKGGVQDLEKARHFLDKYIEVAKAAGERSPYKATEARELQRQKGRLEESRKEVAECGGYNVGD